MERLQLIINPGSTSTKIALYREQERVLQESVSHKPEDLQAYESIADQVPYRLQLIRDFMERNDIKGESLDAVVGRGGLVFGLKSGGYLVNEDLCTALCSDELSQPHASNLGGLLAKAIADQYEIPAFIYDAVTSSELPDYAQITGIPEIRRRSFCHVLNSRAMAIRYANELGKRYEDLNLVIAHLGGGISASVHEHGRIIDSVGDDDGPFSPERSGSVPQLELIRLCYSGEYSRAEMQKKIRGRGGMFAHLGTSDCREIEQRIDAGDEVAKKVFEAQAYQIAKMIGLLSIVLKGNCDAIILTGGLAYSKRLTDLIIGYVHFIAPVIVLPGENEMEALANGGLRLLDGEETIHEYHIPKKEEEVR
ncbi:MAG: butyrate kinase [Erysipelotrichaceae bacterium]|nr:butyrate kinase [Erysipelotrichaceae bacterium]